VHRAHDRIERGHDRDLARGHGEQRAHQGFPDVLGPARCLLEQQERHRLRGGEHDADERLERRAVCAAAQPCEQCCAQQRHAERQQVSTHRVVFVAEHHRHRHAQRSHLRKRQVHEQHAAPHHVEAQVGVDARQHQRGERRDLEERQPDDVEHHGTSG
jgi:hypothetical protein